MFENQGKAEKQTWNPIPPSDRKSKTQNKKTLVKAEHQDQKFFRSSLRDAWIIQNIASVGMNHTLEKESLNYNTLAG